MNTYNNYFKNKRIKTIVIAVLVIIFFAISYFIYANSENTEVFTDEEVLENNNNLNDENEKSDELTKEEKKIIVHVDGEVNTPGIVELSENSRISDAIEKAGGTTENANLKNINLAFLLEDGMKVYIPTNNMEKGEIIMDDEVLNELEYVTEESGVESLEGSGGSSTTTSNKKINLNTANQADLETLPGIGEATALKIIDYRNNNGKFNTIEDIKNVKGIGDSKFEKVKDLIVCK